MDVDQVYEDCVKAKDANDHETAVKLAQQLKTWTFTDEAKEYADSSITALRSFADMVVLVHGPYCKL